MSRPQQLVSLDQVSQLRDLERAHVRRGGVGYGPEFQALLDRLKSGGVSPATARVSGKCRKGKAQLPARDPRILRQAKVLWDKGWGTRLEQSSFQQYLLDIPEIPTFPAGYDEHFPNLILVDKRIQVVEACQMLGVNFDGDATAFVSYDEKNSIKALVYWMRCQDGKAYRNRKPSDCRTEFSSRSDEFGLEAHEGLAFYAQAADLLEVGTVMDLPGSVHSGNRGHYAYLRRWTDGGVKLDWRWDDRPSPSCGSASRGDCMR